MGIFMRYWWNVGIFIFIHIYIYVQHYTTLNVHDYDLPRPMDFHTPAFWLYRGCRGWFSAFHWGGWGQVKGSDPGISKGRWGDHWADELGRTPWGFALNFMWFLNLTHSQKDAWQIANLLKYVEASKNIEKRFGDNSVGSEEFHCGGRISWNLYQHVSCQRNLHTKWVLNSRTLNIRKHVRHVVGTNPFP